MIRVLGLFMLLFSGLVFGQNTVASIEEDCESSLTKFDEVLYRYKVDFSIIENAVYKAIYQDKPYEKDGYALLKEIINQSDTVNHTDNFGAYVNEQLSREINKLNRLSYYRNEIDPYFKYTEYESEYQSTFLCWSWAWYYLKRNAFRILDYAEFYTGFSKNFDLNLECNRKMLIFFLGMVLSDQADIQNRINDYKKSGDIIEGVYESGGVDFDEFEKEINAYLETYEFNVGRDDLADFNFAISDLSMIPLPQSKEKQKLFNSYYNKLLNQSKFQIDDTKIVERPKSQDSVRLLEYIMEAYPDSMMFAPGKKTIEFEIEKVFGKRGDMDKKFRFMVGNVLGYGRKGSAKQLLASLDVLDFESEEFRKWYYLLLLQLMFEEVDTDRGAELFNIEFDWAERYRNLLPFFMHSTGYKTEVINYAPYKKRGNFSSSTFYFELYSNPLFKTKEETYLVQLKIDTMGKVIPEEILMDEQLTLAQQQLMIKALAKYSFDVFYAAGGKPTKGWVQLVFRQKPEEDYDILDVELIEAVADADEKPEEEILSVVDEPAKFPYGEKALADFLKDQKGKEIEAEGTVYVSFVVRKDGTLDRITVVRGINEAADQEARRLVRIMPNWVPGKNDGKEVHSYVTLPIKFNKAE